MESDPVVEIGSPETPSDKKKVASRSCYCYLGSQATFRVVMAVATMAALLIMVFSEQTNTYYGFPIHTSYKSFLAFGHGCKFLLHENTIALGNSLLSIPSVFHMGTGALLNVLDMLATGMLVGVASAASAIGWVGKRGDINAAWSPVCQYVAKFCNRVEASIVCTFLGSGFLLIAIVLSSLSKNSKVVAP